MAKFDVQLPDGNIYEVEAPEGTTDVQAYQYALSQIPPPEPEVGIGEAFGRGFERGKGRLGSTVTDVIPALVGSAVGAEDYTQRQLQEAAEKQAALPAPVFESFKDVEGIGDFTKFVAETIGEQIPNLGVTLATALTGGAAAPALVGATRAAGQLAGAGLGSYALNAPEIFQNIYQETGETAPGTALLFGSAAAALDSVLPAALAKNLSGPMKVGITEKLLEKSGMSRGALRSATAGLAKGLGTEGLTEGAQEGISIAAERFIDDNPDIFGSEEFNRIMEASVRGAVAGGGFGTVGGGVEGARETRRLRDLEEAEKLQAEIDRKIQADEDFTKELDVIREQDPQGDLFGAPVATSLRPAPTEEEQVATKEQVAAEKKLAKAQQELFTAEGEPTKALQRKYDSAVKAEEKAAKKQRAAQEKQDAARRKQLLEAEQAALSFEPSPEEQAIVREREALDKAAVEQRIRNEAEQTVRARFEGSALPANFETQVAEEIETIKGRADEAQGDIFAGMPEGEITRAPAVGRALNDFLKEQNLPINAATKKAFAGLDLAIPEQRAQAISNLREVAEKSISTANIQRIDAAIARLGGTPSQAVEAVDTTEITSGEEKKIEQAVKELLTPPAKRQVKAVPVTPAVAATPMSAESLLADQAVVSQAESTPAVPETEPVVDEVVDEEQVGELAAPDVPTVLAASALKRNPSAKRDAAAEVKAELKTLKSEQELSVEERRELRAIEREQELDLKTPAYRGEPLSQELADIARRGNFRQLVTRLIPNQSTEIKRVLRKISSLGLTTKVVVAPTEQGTSGSYDPNTNTITLDPDTGLNEHTFLHETVHAAISQVLNDPNQPLTKQFFEFYSGIHTNIDGFYGGQDLQEFAAELIGNPEFQAYLKQIKAPKSQSLWQNIMDAIARFFGFRRGENAYTKGVDFIDQILDVSQGVEPSLDDKLFLGTPKMSVDSMRDLMASGKDLAGKKKENLLDALSRLRGTDGGGIVVSNAMRAMRIQDFIKLFGDKIPPLKPLQDAILGRQGFIEKGVNYAQANYKQFKKLTRELPAQAVKLTSIAHQARRDEIDLVGVDPEFNLSKLDAEKRAKYNRLKNQFNQLDPRMREMYKTMRQDYRNMYDRFRKYVEDQAQDKGQLAQLREEFTRKTSAIGYVPFLRFGDYFVEYTSGGERYVEAFESPRKRAKFVEENRSSMEGEPELFDRPENGEYNASSFPDGSFAKRIMDVLPADQRSEVYQVILSLYPANSFMQRTRRAKLTKGEELDLARGYGDTMLKWTRKQGNLEFLPVIQDNLRKIGDIRGIGLETAVRDEIGRRAEFIQSPHYGSGISFAATSAYNLFLLGNVSSAIVNLSSVPLLSLPLLSGQYGFGKTNSALLKAMKLANPFIKNRDAWKQDPKYKNLYEALMDKAQLEHTVQREIVEGSRQRTEDYDSFGAKVMNLASIPFTEGEKYSRAVTAIAAYDLAKAQGKSEQVALDEAVSTVIDVHTSGMAAEGPQLMQDAFGGLGRVMFTFKSFIWNSAFVIARTMNKALRDQDPEVRKIARRQVFGIYAMSAGIAGINGLPFFGAAATVANIANAIMGDEDEPFNAKEDMRLFAGELAYKGPLNYFTNREISNRVGLANGLMFREDPYSLEQNGYLMTALAQATGPMGSYLQGVENVLMKDGRPELLLPSALRNVLKTGRYMQEGARNKDGAPIDTDLSGWDLFFQTFGFAPADTSSLYENRAAAANYQSKVKDRRQKILKKYYVGVTTGDSDTISEALREYTEFAALYPEIINKDTLERSFRSQQAYQQELIAGLRFDKRLRNKFLETIDD